MIPAEFSSSNSPTPEEMRHLVDLLYDGGIDEAGLERIDTLLLTSPACLQAYVEHIDFHCELIDQADQTPPETAALTSMRKYSQATQRRALRTQRRVNLVMLASCLLVAVGLGWMFYASSLSVPPEAGTVICLSTHARSAAPLELGQVIRQGETLQITEGVVSLQLPDVVVNIVAPARLTCNDSRRLFLKHGTVIATVGPTGRGFTVSTPDGEVVDLGTEFLVRHDKDEGTYVSVRRGAAQAKLHDWRGAATKVVELTTSRAAKMNSSEETVQEIAYQPEQYHPADRSQAGIRRITGALRTIDEIPASLKANMVTTPNHMLVIPERQSVELDAPLTVESLSGPVTLPKGAIISSYLLHYDPTSKVSFAPRGSVTFFGPIAALIGSSQGLLNTDPLFGLDSIAMETEPFRQLELEEDEIQISDDRRTVSFFWGVSPPNYLDQLRILVVN